MPSVATRALVGLLLVAALLSAAPPAGADDGGLAAARRRANEVAGQLADAESRLGGIEADLAALGARAASATATLDALRATVRQVAVRRFINSQASLFSYADPDLNVQARADSLARYATLGSQDAIDQYTAASDDLTRTQAALARKKADQRRAIRELRQRRAAVAEELRRLALIQAEQQRLAAVRAAITANAQSAAAAAAKAAAAAPTVPGASEADAPVPVSAPVGGMICPVQGPVAFTDTWGAPRSGGRVHLGVDMLSPRGTPTVAPVSGRLEHRGNSTGGLSWHLYGDDGTYYYGTHLSAYASEGAGHVAAGTVIGYVGDTGNARGTPHLHFEIHPGNGPAVNPYPATSAAC